MTSDDKTSGSSELSRPWVHRSWCVNLALILLTIGFLANLLFLYFHCPFDLSEDESQYWDWSRHLDWGYYSKGPGIAAIIHLAVVVGNWFGQQNATMPVVRTPAVIFSFISGLVGILLARRIFRDDRVSLMMIVLSAGMPMFAIGSLLITIDSPMYCAWALAAFCIWRAIEPEWNESTTPPFVSLVPARPFWLYAAGLFTGLGVLAKPVVLFIPCCVIIAAIFNRFMRRRFATRHAVGALILAMLLQVPTLLWNAQHNWVMFRHIGGQGGLGDSTALISHLTQMPINVLIFVLSQVGVLVGVFFVLLILAVIQAVRVCRTKPDSYDALIWSFLLSFSLPIFAFYFLLSFWTKVEPNWPAAGYFTAMILLAGAALEHWNGSGKSERFYRQILIAGVVMGFACLVVFENINRFYPLIGANHAQELVRLDPTSRLYGLQQRALDIDEIRDQMSAPGGPKPLVIAARWDTASS
ncbi:MAG TPA: glycosyltransferase family 39 protein, partial [Phycisphaerae bacterium]|nr:glycosyltransferase family 39 protein [Phycisphaerae bacterium]